MDVLQAAYAQRLSILMNLPAASGRGILIDQLFPYRPKGRGIKPEEIKPQNRFKKTSRAFYGVSTYNRICTRY